MISELKLQIGICDDEILIMEKLKSMVSSCLQELGYDHCLFCYHSGNDIVEAAENLDIIFLDIAMPGMDGIMAGQKIYYINKDCKIVMASSMVERFKETYHFNAFRFITKPYQKDEIKESLKAAVRQGVGAAPVELYKDRIKYGISQRKIKYIMAYDSYVEVLAGNYMFRKEASLNEMERCLDNRLFYRIHKQYIINMLWISEYTNDLIFIGGKEFKISRRKKSEFNNKYMHFDINYR